MRKAGCRQYSLDTYRKVEDAFFSLAEEYDPIGKAIMIQDIVDRSGTSKGQVTRVIHDANWWDESRVHASLSEAARRQNINEEVKGYQNLKKGLIASLASQSAQGYPNLVKARIIQKKRGYVELKKAAYTHTVLGAPMKDTHPSKIRGINRRIQILNALSTAPHDISLVEIGRRIGITSGMMTYHLRILRAQGLIDEHNNIIDGTREGEAI